MRLCFGTFAKVLNICRLPHVTDKELVGTLTLTVDENCEYKTSEGSTISRLLSCQQNLSNGTERRTKQKQKNNHQGFETGLLTNRLSNVIRAAQDAKLDIVISKFEENVICLIDSDKVKLAISALFDIINSDITLDNGNENTTKFEKYIGKTKNDLLLQEEFVFSELLARIFLYTAVAVKNTVGKACIKDINVEYLKQFSANGVNKITVFMTKITESADHEVDETIHDDEVEQQQELGATNVTQQMTNQNPTFNTFNFNGPLGNFINHADKVENNYYGGEKVGE